MEGITHLSLTIFYLFQFYNWNIKLLFKYNILLFISQEKISC